MRRARCPSLFFFFCAALPGGLLRPSPAAAAGAWPSSRRLLAARSASPPWTPTGHHKAHAVQQCAVQTQYQLRAHAQWRSAFWSCAGKARAHTESALEQGSELDAPQSAWSWLGAPPLRSKPFRLPRLHSC